MYMHHEKLLRILQAQKNTQKINEYRHAHQSEVSKVDEITDHKLAIPGEIESAMQDCLTRYNVTVLMSTLRKFIC